MIIRITNLVQNVAVPRLFARGSAAASHRAAAAMSMVLKFAGASAR